MPDLNEHMGMGLTDTVITVDGSDGSDVDQTFTIHTNLTVKEFYLVRKVCEFLSGVTGAKIYVARTENESFS